VRLVDGKFRLLDKSDPAAPDGDETAAYEKWFQSEQGKAYDGMWAFARAAWMARAALSKPRQSEAKPHDFSDNNGSTCVNCGASDWATGTPCDGPRQSEAVAVAEASVHLGRVYLVYRDEWLMAADHKPLSHGTKLYTAPPPAIPDGMVVGEIVSEFRDVGGYTACIQWVGGEHPGVGTKLYTYPSAAIRDGKAVDNG
jgi:hypothetical protein